MSIKNHLGQTKFESPAQEAMLSVLVTAGYLARALEDACTAHGITHDQYNVLRILRGAHPEGHPRYAIAQRLIDRSPDVTRLLDRLERDGLVERYRSDEDRRLSISRITDRGLKLLATLDPTILAVHERFAGKMKKTELEEMARLCGAVLDEVLGERPQ